MKDKHFFARNTLLCALAVVIMYVGSVFGKLDIVTAVLSSVCVAVSLAESGYKSSVTVYLVTAVLSLLLIPSKTAPALFTAFLGYYPIVKLYAETRFSKITAYIIKFANINIAAIILLLIALSFAKIHIVVIALLFVAANILLPLFDFALGYLVSLYYSKIRRK